MNFLDNIFCQLDQRADAPVLQEIREGHIEAVTGRELVELAAAARAFLAKAGLKKSDRCALLAPNSIRWAALDLAMMAEGIITVPLYVRQARAELIRMLKDCSAARVCCAQENSRREIADNWSGAPPISIFDEIFDKAGSSRAPTLALAPTDSVTIIYTSGTSGEPKGVVLNVANIDHMLSCTRARLDQLMGYRRKPDRVFHYLPFCFAGPWILLLSCLSRSSVLTLATDLSHLADDIKIAAPDYFLNVPTLLERTRFKIEQKITERGGMASRLFEKAKDAFLRRHMDETRALDSLWLVLARSLMFPAIRKSLGPNLKALICGSAPLALETQLFFLMLEVPVLQVYGLTETTAICTMDDPIHVEPGLVGPAIPGIEMRLGENNEILARGPNIFPGYWNRPEDTSRALRDGWFHTGDQGEVTPDGNWKIIGRLKNLIILNSGHNIAPEPLEDRLAKLLPGAQQVMLVGNNRSYLAAIITAATTNNVTREKIESALRQLNAGLPHYKQVRAFHLERQPFTAEDGLVTVNGKLRRDAIETRLRDTIEAMFVRNGP